MKTSDKMIELAKSNRVKIYEPFAEFLNSSPEEIHFEISLLDCFHLSGHACHSMTGAFLVTQTAIEHLFPESKTCTRGDLIVEFGSKINEKATGPRSNVISYITGAWGETGFPGLKGQFSRKNLISYGHDGLIENEIRFRRISNDQVVTISYNPSLVTQELKHGLDFPKSWRVEILAVLENSNTAISIKNTTQQT